MVKSLLLAGAAFAAAPALSAPSVVADIPAAHSLVAQVMQGVGEPELIVQPGASPHGYSMRPSEAAALEAADIVVWIGPELTPWLGRAIDSLAAEAETLALLDVPAAVTLPFREGATFEAHDHGDDHDEHGHEDHAHGDHEHDEGAEAEHAHEEHGDEDHAHDDHDHDDHAHEGHGHEDHDEHAHDDHEHEHDERAHAGHDHDHDGVDPHAWLDPENAKIWLDAIAGALSAADPENAGAYFANAAEGKAALDGLIDEIETDLAPLGDRGFVVFHDAYQYFERRFGVEAAGAISVSDAAAPGPARVAEIRDAIAEMDAACVFSEPQFEPALVETVTEGVDARTGVLDPLGADLPLGPDLYPALLRGMRDGLVECLGG